MAHIEQKPTAPVPSGIPDERTIQAVMRQTLLSREDVLIYLSGLNDDDSLALELSRLTATQTIEDTRQEIQTASISADAIAYAWGDSLHAPSVETFERLSEKFPKADVIVILLYALSESPFYAIDAGPLDRSGKSLLLDTQIEKLTSTRDTFKFALIHEFARYFALGHNYDCSTFDDLREELRDEDDGDEAAIQIPRPERDLFGDLALDEVALSGASIQEALLEVRALFPDVLMQLALETVLNHAKQMGTRSLLSTLRSLDNLLEKDPTTLQRLIAASGGLTEPHYAATDSVEDTEDEDLAVASSKPAPCTPDIVYADPRGDFGDLSYGPIDLLVAIEAQLTNQALICAKNSGVLPRYHGSSPRNLYEDLPTLLRLGISPELVELVKSDPEIIARLIEINRESLNKLAANEKSSEWAEAARTFWEISADLRDERGEISIDRVRYLLESILPETSIADRAQAARIVRNHARHALIEALDARQFYLYRLTSHVDSNPNALELRGAKIQLYDEVGALRDPVFSEAFGGLSRFMDMALDFEEASYDEDASSRMPDHLTVLKRLLAHHRFSISIDASGVLSRATSSGIEISEGERLIGTINPNEHGFETFTQLLEANGFGESRVRGYLHDGAVQGDYRYTPNEVRYPLEMIPKDDFRRILRFLDPKIKSGGLLFAVVKLPESQPFYRLVGRVQEVTKLTSEELL